MLVIGHRGASGLAPENTLESFRAGLDAGADILEFDVRVTVDRHPILSHDPRLHRRNIKRSTLAEIEENGPVLRLETLLDEFFGKILLNLEYKPTDDIDVVIELLKGKYIKSEDDWDNIMFSSFQIKSLTKLRNLEEKANLALLHSINPFAFVTYNRKLRLSAVGWHRLHVNNLAIAIAKKAELFTYVYTVNRPKAARILAQKGIDAVVTDYPDRVTKAL